MRFAAFADGTYQPAMFLGGKSTGLGWCNTAKDPTEMLRNESAMSVAVSVVIGVSIWAAVTVLALVGYRFYKKRGQGADENFFDTRRLCAPLLSNESCNHPHY